MQVWRINTRTQTASQEPVLQTWERLGGRGLLSKIMVDEVEAGCEPLGPKNKLIFALGLLAGHNLSSRDRVSVGGKSSLTGGITDAQLWHPCDHCISTVGSFQA